MNITLKNVKIHPDMSEETNCFSATICLDGKAVGEVKNDGRGGCNSYYWGDRDASKRINEWADKQPTEFEFEKLDQLVDDLLRDAESLRWLKRNTKSKTLFRLKGDKKGEWRIVKAPFDAKVFTFLQTKYGPQLENVANQNLEAAVPFCS